MSPDPDRRPQAPDWVDAEECHRCRVQFGVVTRKVSTAGLDHPEQPQGSVCQVPDHPLLPGGPAPTEGPSPLGRGWGCGEQIQPLAVWPAWSSRPWGLMASAAR